MIQVLAPLYNRWVLAGKVLSPTSTSLKPKGIDETSRHYSSTPTSLSRVGKTSASLQQAGFHPLLNHDSSSFPTYNRQVLVGKEPSPTLSGKKNECKQAPTHNEVQVEFNVIPVRTMRTKAVRSAHAYGLLVDNQTRGHLKT